MSEGQGAADAEPPALSPGAPRGPWPSHGDLTWHLGDGGRCRSHPSCSLRPSSLQPAVRRLSLSHPPPSPPVRPSSCLAMHPSSLHSSAHPPAVRLSVPPSRLDPPARPSLLPSQPSVCLSIGPFIHPSIIIHPSNPVCTDSRPVCPSLYASVCPAIPLSILPSTRALTRPSVHPPLYRHIHTLVRPSISACTHPPVCVSVPHPSSLSPGSSPQPPRPAEGTQASWPGRRKRKRDEWEVTGTNGWWQRQAHFRPCPHPHPLPAPATAAGTERAFQPTPAFGPAAVSATDAAGQHAGDTGEAVAPWGVSLEPKPGDAGGTATIPAAPPPLPVKGPVEGTVALGMLGTWTCAIPAELLGVPRATTCPQRHRATLEPPRPQSHWVSPDPPSPQSHRCPQSHHVPRALPTPGSDTHRHIPSHVPRGTQLTLQPLGVPAPPKVLLGSLCPPFWGPCTLLGSKHPSLGVFHPCRVPAPLFGGLFTFQGSSHCSLGSPHPGLGGSLQTQGSPAPLLGSLPPLHFWGHCIT